jgi:hypothetical protein
MMNFNKKRALKGPGNRFTGIAFQRGGSIGRFFDAATDSFGKVDGRLFALHQGIHGIFEIPAFYCLYILMVIINGAYIRHL